MVGRNRQLRRQDFKEDVVYLFEPPRATYIPNVSPFSLKLETWLRMNEIAYEAAFVDLLNVSKKGQVPFVELNGKEIADSRSIMAELGAHFNKEDKLDKDQKAVARALEALIEDSLFFVLITVRSLHCDTLLSDPALVRMLPAPLRHLRALAVKMFSARLKSKAFHQGMGRHSVDEVNARGAELLQAVSTFLADKDYLFGEKASWLDAVAFGHLSQFWFTPLNLELKKTIETEHPTIVAYLERIKSAYWPDWAELCAAAAPKATANKKEANNTSKADAVAEKAADESPAKDGGPVDVAAEAKVDTPEVVVTPQVAVESQ